MADGTHIEWTEATWNPITGCSLASPGCTNCYAMQLAGTRLAHIPSRAGLTQPSKAGPVWTGEVRFNEHELTHPLRWKRPRPIFVCAHGDLFHESVPDAWIDRIFAVMALCGPRILPNGEHWAGHTFQVLTKRSARMRDYLSQSNLPHGRMENVWLATSEFATTPALKQMICNDLTWGKMRDRWPLPNVWLGVSVEDQQRADERIPDLLATPAAVRWISAEPLLGPVNLRSIAHTDKWDPFDPFNCLTGPEGLDWVVVGGESGSKARPMHPDWARSLRDQCAAAGVPFFFKQWGEWAPVCEMAEELIESCYRPAPEHDPEAIRRCKVDQCVLHNDGDRFNGEAMFQPPAFWQGKRAMTMFNVGKKRAGRLLDGVEHNGMPGQ